MTQKLLFLTSIIILFFTDAWAQFGFRELHVGNASAQIDTTTFDSRASGWGDFDGDGWLDLYVANFGSPNEVYLNDGNPDPLTGAVSFTNNSSTSQADLNGNSVAVAIADYDNDGFDDIFVVTQNESHKLYRSLGNGAFLDVSGTALSLNENATSAAWGDFNNDGFVDLVVGTLNGPVHLFQNLTGTGFTDVALAVGITGNKGVQSVTVTDLNQDTRLDIYLVKGSPTDATNEIFINTSDPVSGGFTFQQQNAFYGAIGSSATNFGAELSDIDNDGDYDLYLATDGQNEFLRNSSTAFVNETGVTGIGFSGKTVGVAMVDVDQNGFDDVFILNEGANPYIWLHDGTSFTNKFNDLLGSLGYSSPTGETSLSHADYDNDGDVDFFITISGDQNILLRNECLSNQSPSKGNDQINLIFCGLDNWLGVNLQGTQSNFRGIGARVVFKTQAGDWVREVTGGGNPGSQSSHRIEIGFGMNVPDVDTIKVFWPSGIIQDVSNTPTNQIITIVEDDCPNRFVDVTDSAGLGIPSDGTGFGAAWGDYDNDGDLDIVNIKNGEFFLYSNDGDGTFTTIPPSVTGIIPSGGTTRKASIFCDFNNDGLLDILLGKNIFIHKGMTSTPIYQMIPFNSYIDPLGNPGGFDGPTVAVSVLDYDKDTFLDFYVAGASLNDDNLFHNSGPMAPDSSLMFYDRAVSLNLVQNNQLDWFTHSVTCVDFDGDGWVDIYAGHDNHGGQRNMMFKNNGLNSLGQSNPFSEVAVQLGINHNNTWSSAFGDYDNDGLVDIFISSTNFFAFSIYNTLYKHQVFAGDHFFTDVATTAGVSGTQPTKTWESGWADYDNDGWLDIFVGQTDFPSHLYHNEQNGTFTDVAQLLSIPAYINQVTDIAWADYDDDGLLDVYVSTQLGANRLLRNQICNNNNYIKLNLIGSASNRSAIGSRVKLYVNGMIQYREVIGGMGRSMESLEVEFGLGQAVTIDSLVVLWPSGTYELFYDGEIAINGTTTLVETGCVPAIEVSPQEIEFLNGVIGSSDSTQMIIKNDGPCYVSIHDIYVDNPTVNNVTTFSNKTFVMEPFSSDTLMVHYTHIFNNVSSEIKVIYNGVIPVEIPFEASFDPVSVSENSSVVPEKYELRQNFPNPFNPSTTIAFDLPKSGFTRLSVYNIQGQLVKELVNSNLDADYHKVSWDGTDSAGRKVSSGIYLYKLQSGNFVQTNKMIMLK